MTVHERIAKAIEVIASTDFSKSGKVTGGATYNFIPIGQILQAVRKAHATAGLFLTMGQLEYDDQHGEGIFTSDRWTKARGHCEVTINGADGDSVSFVVPFNVQDNSDKLDNKILTNIERQAYRLIYAIDEGDATDPETEWQEDQVAIPKTDRKARQNEAAKKNIVDKLLWYYCADDKATELINMMIAERGIQTTTDMEVKGALMTFGIDDLMGIKEAIEKSNGKVA